MQTDNPEQWKISAEERQKHNSTFMQLNTSNGTLLSGEQVKPFFLKSGLPTQVLGQIWNLADLNKDGSLDKKEFSIACFLIKKVLTSPLGASCLPLMCPSSLLIEPMASQTTPLLLGPILTNKTITTPPNTTATSTITNTSTISTQPLFQATFTSPTLPTQPITPSLQHFPTTSTSFVSPPTVQAHPPPPGGVFTPLVALDQNLPNPLVPIPPTSRSKYTQVFQSNDSSSTGYLTGQQAKTLLMQTGLNQTVLIQVWNLADCDKDGKLNLEEFIIAMHLCDYAKSGNILPSTLPMDLQPSRSRAGSSLNTPISPDMLLLQQQFNESPPLGIKHPNSFEDKRRENFDRGNAVLEAKRQALREQEEREKREREEKERIEQEKKQKIKEEQEKRRLAEMEKQMERQRLIDLQREEERKKILEQREKARNELIRQQRLEWEKQKKLELEQQRLKLQEQLSTAKAKDKNLEFDMQALNEKISSYKTKIADSHLTLNEFNQRLDQIRKANIFKQNEFEQIEKNVRDYTQIMNRTAQEKFNLNEELKNLNQDSPFAEQYRNDASLLKSKEAVVQKLKVELENLEKQISSARTQLEVVKHELEVTKSDENDLIKENDRLSKLIELKRNNLFGSNNNNINKTNSNPSLFKNSQSVNNIRSDTPKDNYDAFKNEIKKIQQTTSMNSINNSNINTTIKSPSSHPTSPLHQADPFSPLSTTNQIQSPQNSNNIDFNVDWSSAFEQHNEPNVNSNNTNNTNTSFGLNHDPFSSNTAQPTNNFDDLWTKTQDTKISDFSNAFASSTLPTSTSASNGFGIEDNWASAFNETNTKLTNSNSINNNLSTSSNWAAFEDESKQNSSFKQTVDFFNSNLKLNSPTHKPTPPVHKTNQVSSPVMSNNVNSELIKYKALYSFEASREDELSIYIDDVINVDLNVRTDEGWLYGECKGKVGVFPASFTCKLSDLEAIQEESFTNQNVVSHQPEMKQDQLVTNIKNYFISIYPYMSNELGDLNFKEFEIINVINQNEDWLTGQIVGSGIDPSHPLRSGIFPANFVIKFNLPLDYIGKHTISMPVEAYVAQNNGELSLDPNLSQLIAIKKVSPDGKWSFGEIYDLNGQMQRGWFPINAATPLIDSGILPIYNPSANNNNKSISQSASINNLEMGNTLSVNNNSSGFLNHSPPPPSNEDKKQTTTSVVKSASATKLDKTSSPVQEQVKPEPVIVQEHKQETKVAEAVEENKQLDLPNVVIDKVIALYDFVPQTEGAIGFPKDAVINILEKSGDWWLGEYNGNIGILPYNYVQSIQNPVIKREKSNNSKTNRSLSLSASLQNLDKINFYNKSNRQTIVNSLVINETDSSDQSEDNNLYINSDFDNFSETSSLDQNQQCQETSSKMKHKVIEEVFKTEQSYINSLKTVIDLYKNPIQRLNILNPIELDSLFGNIDEILHVNKKFLNALFKKIEEAKQRDQLAKIADVFLLYFPRMECYTKFVSSKRSNEEQIFEKIKSSTEFMNTINKSITNDSSEFILKKLLILPMQRLTQYQLLIDKLIKYTCEADDDLNQLKQSSKLIIDLIKQINNEVGKKDDLEKLEWLDEHVNVKSIGYKFKSTTNMMGPRKLYYYGPLTKESGKELYALLFNDTLVILESNENLQSEIFKPRTTSKFQQYQLYKNPFLLENINLVNSKIVSDCSFQISCNDKEYLFKTTNPTLRNEWMKQIQKAIEIYRLKKRSVVQSISATNLSQRNAIGRCLLLVMEAQDLMLESSNEKHIFCEASMGIQKFNTHSIDSANPKWNTSMQFQIYDLNKDILSVIVYDKKIYRPNVFLGKTEIKLIQIYREQMKDSQENNPIIRMFRMNNVSSGKIMLKMSISIYK